MGWEKYAWQRRTTPINIHIILQKEKGKIVSGKNKVLDTPNHLLIMYLLGRIQH
jgi:hypothetical protein